MSTCWRADSLFVFRHVTARVHSTIRRMEPLSVKRSRLPR